MSVGEGEIDVAAGREERRSRPARGLSVWNIESPFMR